MFIIKDTFQWIDSKKHLKLCKFRPVKCKFCYETFPLDAVADHREKECSKYWKFKIKTLKKNKAKIVCKWCKKT